eukprot:s147_g24.t1
MTFTIILTFTPQEQYSAPPPPPAPAAGTAVAKPKPKPARDLRSPKLSLDKILQDLEGSEDASYSAAFSTMAGDQAQLTPDNPALRTFLEQYSGVTDAFAIDCSNFVMLLRLNPLNEAEALESFLRLSGGGDQITAEDCRTGLFQVIQSIGASFCHPGAALGLEPPRNVRRLSSNWTVVEAFPRNLGTRNAAHTLRAERQVAEPMERQVTTEEVKEDR